MKRFETTASEKMPEVTRFADGKVLVCYGQEKETACERVMDCDGKEVEVKHEMWRCRCVELCPVNGTEQALLSAAKAGVLKEIGDYDSSDAVNSFCLRGKWLWIPKETRLGLRNNVSDTEAIGGKEVTFWFGGFGSVTVGTKQAKGMLVALENYAFGCYNVTAEHKAKVEAMDHVEEVLMYDFRVGYPEKLVIQGSALSESGL